MFRKIKHERYIDLLLVVICFLFPLLIYWPVIAHNKIMVTGDGINFFAPKIFQYKSISSGEIPIWNSYVITGTSLVADPNNTYFYPFHALALILPTALYTNIYYILHLGLAGFFTYLFLKQSTDNRLIAFVGAIVFSSSIAIGGSRKEHGWVYTSIIWLPLVLYFIQTYLKTGKKRYILFSSAAMAIQFFGGNPQLTLYSDIFAFFFFIWFLVVNKYQLKECIKSLLLWLGGYLLFSAIALIPMIELIIYSARATTSQIFCLYSSSWELLLMTVFPRVFGENLAHPFEPYRSGEVSVELYLGIIPLFYAIYAVRYKLANRFIQFASLAPILAFLYSSSCNLPILGDVLQKIPLLNFFRVQSRVLFIFVFFGICCFAYGISDIKNSDQIKRLLKFNAFMLGALVFTAAVINAVGHSPIGTETEATYYSFTSPVFLTSIGIAVLNVLLLGIISLLREKENVYRYSSSFVVLVLLLTTVWDVERFSGMHPEVTLDAMTKTEEVKTLEELLHNDPYRIVTAYDNYDEADYMASGLSNNRSMISQIRNLKGRTEFENPRLNELLGQSESRDNSNIHKLVTDDSILSMLSVRYVLFPAGTSTPESFPDLPDVVIINRPITIDIPGNNELYVDYIPLPLDINRYYRVDFDLSAANSNAESFYVDFYGGPEYDSTEQQQAIPIKIGYHSYSTVLYSGDEALPSEVVFRIVAKSNSPMSISNLTVTRLIPASKNPDYTLVAHTSRYSIYKLNRAQKLLYIPGEVKSIEDDDALRKKPEDYQELDRVSYIKDYKNFVTSGSLTILSVKNNSLEARIISENTTFVNHAQSYYPGWKAYIDGKQTQIYLVNGVIQGVEVPAGEHIVKFVFYPVSLQAGAFISIMTLLTAIGLMLAKRL